eukprot:05618_4
MKATMMLPDRRWPELQGHGSKSANHGDWTTRWGSLRDSTPNLTAPRSCAGNAESPGRRARYGPTGSSDRWSSPRTTPTSL